MAAPTQADNPGVIALPPLLYGITLTIALIVHWLVPMRIVSVPLGFWAGLALLLLGGILAVWGQRTMRQAGTNVNPSLPATALVTTGPFRYSRNPLYVALTLLYVGLVLAINTVWGAVALLPLLVVMHQGVITREERYLEDKFGEAYRSYRSHTRRWM